MIKKKDPKARIFIKLEKSMIKNLRMLAQSKRESMTGIVEAALNSFFEEEVFGNLYSRKLDKMFRRMGKVEKDQQQIIEVLGRFASIYFANSPPVPEDEKEAAAKLGQERFTVFKRLVAEGLAGKKGMRTAIEKEIRRQEEKEDKDNEEEYL